jgi:hypothetical protein
VLSYITLSTFLSRIDLTAVAAGVKEALDACPPPESGDEARSSARS